MPGFTMVKKCQRSGFKHDVNHIWKIDQKIKQDRPPAFGYGLILKFFYDCDQFPKINHNNYLVSFEIDMGIDPK